ncbi:hypothetical protein BAT_2744 [Bacillus pumilus ATCC 7061]|nr:hypothetical protein BAT_2744 [Bacillus pumilus ATCC 7061]
MVSYPKYALNDHLPFVHCANHDTCILPQINEGILRKNISYDSA